MTAVEQWINCTIRWHLQACWGEGDAIFLKIPQKSIWWQVIKFFFFLPFRVRHKKTPHLQELGQDLPQHRHLRHQPLLLHLLLFLHHHLSVFLLLHHHHPLLLCRALPHPLCRRLRPASSCVTWHQKSLRSSLSEHPLLPSRWSHSRGTNCPTT